MEKGKEERIKELLSGKAGLAVVCYYLHHKSSKIKLKKLSKYLGIEIEEFKHLAKELEAEKVAQMNHSVYGAELEFDSNQEERIKFLINQIIWEKKEEYGKIYKQLITSELMDFMSGTSQKEKDESADRE